MRKASQPWGKAAQRMKEKEARVRKQVAPPRRKFPVVEKEPDAPLAVGEWLIATRAGFENDLIEEIAFTEGRSEKVKARKLALGLVAATQLPKREGRPVEFAFARQGFVVSGIVPIDEIDAPSRIAHAVRGALSQKSAKPLPTAFDLWFPDSDDGNPLSQRAAKLAEDARAAFVKIGGGWSSSLVEDARAALHENGLYAQVCLLDATRAAVGVGYAREALSLAPGGRLRVHVDKDAPSRAAMKLVEAFAWLDRRPEPGELCVDLGAAPGGWTYVLLKQRLNVLAVDPANLAPSIRGHKALTHLKLDAFRFEPEDAVDWLFSDMAWRPLEAAALLTKWARRGWARSLVANIKLPMKKKAEMLFRIRDILTDGGWKNLRVRQLYHDREEITVAAVRF